MQNKQLSKYEQFKNLFSWFVILWVIVDVGLVMCYYHDIPNNEPAWVFWFNVALIPAVLYNAANSLADFTEDTWEMED